MTERRLTIFLSGTRRDVPGFWEAARDALAKAYPGFSIAMMESAEPEGIPGDHWSRREATKPDVLLGLVGRYYGNVLREGELSLTEQEFDVAGQVGIERLMFTTEYCAPLVLAQVQPNDSERIERFRRKVDSHVFRRGVSTPEEFAEHAVAAIRHWETATLGGALQRATDYFAPLLKPDLLYSHTEALVGQSETVDALVAFCESPKRILVLHAPWGRGKSRVLLELSRRVPRLGFLRDDVPLSRQHLGISAADDLVMVVDDVQRRDHLQLRHLLAFLHRCSPNVKLVVASRSTHRADFTAMVRSEGFPGSSLAERELPDLTEAQQHDLVVQVLGRRDEQTYQLAVRTRGSALAAVLAARMIQGSYTTMAELSQNADFVAEVLGRFQGALLDRDLDPGTRERFRGLLQLIAICGPIRPAEREQLDAMAQFLGRHTDEVRRDIDGLENRGLLLRRGGLLMIPVDAVREAEAQGACVTTRGDLTGFAERALRELTGTFRGNLLKNLALVDYQSRTSLFDKVWPELRATYDTMPASQRLALLSDLKRAAYYHPNEALQFVAHALPSGIGPPETDDLLKLYGPTPLEYLYDALTGVLRGALYNPASVADACGLLWRMAKDDRRAAAQHTDCAERALLDLATFSLYRPLDCYDRFLGWAESHLSNGTIPGHRIVAYLAPLLAKELERGYSDDTAMHFWAEPLSLEKVLPLHERVLRMLRALAESTDIVAASAAITAMAIAVRPPAGSYGRQVSAVETAAWENEQREAFRALQAISASRNDRVVDVCMLAAIDGIADYSEQETLRRMAAEFTRELKSRLDLTPELAMVPYWRGPWNAEDDSDAEYDASIAATAARLNGDGAPEVVVKRLRDAYDRLVASRQDVHAATLLRALVRGSEGVGTAFVASVLVDDPPIAEETGGVFAAFLEAPSPERLALFDTAVRDGGRHMRRAVARGYRSPGWRMAAGEERFLDHCRALLLSEDPIVRIEVIRTIRFATDIPSTRRIALLLDYDPSHDPPQFDAWAMAIEHFYKEIPEAKRRSLIAIFARLPSLGAFDDNVLDKLSADEPAAVVDMLLARVRRADDPGYEAHSSGHVRGSNPFSRLPATERERGLRELAPLLGDGSFRIQDAAQELFATLAGGNEALSRRVRLAWVETGNAELVLASAQSFRREPEDVLFDQEDVVVRILDSAGHLGSDLYKSVTSELVCASSNEVRIGSAGDPDSLDSRIRDRAQAVADKHPAGSSARKFYSDLAVHTQSMIDLVVQHEQERGLEP